MVPRPMPWSMPWCIVVGVTHAPAGSGAGGADARHLPRAAVPLPPRGAGGRGEPPAQVTQAPLYGIDGVFETFENWNNGTTGGLDVYEPWFQVVPQGVRWVDHLKLPGAPGAVGAAPVRREAHRPPPVQDRRALLLLPHTQVMGFLFGHIYLKSCCIFFSSIYGASFAEQYYSEV